MPAIAAAALAGRGRLRSAPVGVDARQQLRLYLRAVPRWTGQISVHAARARRRFRDAGVLWPVADIDADHHRPVAEGRTPWPGGCRVRRPVRALPCRLRAEIRGDASWLF